MKTFFWPFLKYGPNWTGTLVVALRMKNKIYSNRYSLIKSAFLSEVWQNMPGQNAAPSFENGKCKFDVPVDIEDFINEISVTYGKGAFILKGSFQERTNYHLRASTGTDMGICATINPVVSISSRPGHLSFKWNKSESSCTWYATFSLRLTSTPWEDPAPR